MSSIDLTEERVIPKKMNCLNSLLLEHIARYHFSVNEVTGRVLDIACGVGYGSFLIAKYCKKSVPQVVGIDCDPATIHYANRTYNHPRCTYYVDDALRPDLADTYGQFDSIMSFETLEHLNDDRAFLHNLKTLLKPGGKLIVSTPLGAGRAYPSKQDFHKFQLTEEEFIDLFQDFSLVSFYQQHGLVFRPYEKGQKYPIMIAVATKKSTQPKVN